MCGCGKPVNTRPKGYITKAKVIIRKAWESAVTEEKQEKQEKPVTVKQINKT